MSWRDAPLYVKAHELARWVVEHATRSSPEDRHPLAGPVTRSACDLLAGVSQALTFPDSRARRLAEADDAIVRLRVRLRLARDLGLVSPRGLRIAAGRLQAVGRMVGRWRKRVEPRGRLPPAVGRS